MTTNRFQYLFSHYINKTCTAQEKDELMKLVSDPAHESLVRSLLLEVIENTGPEAALPPEKAQVILKNILHASKAEIIPLQKRNMVFVSWMRVTAAVGLVVIAGTLYGLVQFHNRNDQLKTTVAAPKSKPVLPGGNRALLTMADGHTIELDSIGNGALMQLGNTNIQKQGAVLLYNTPSKMDTDNITYNILATPRGGQYRVVLCDGSQVWLNAASSLRFPTIFTGNSRDVELTGEAYFEVAKDENKPFRVLVNGMQVNVLGTHFNINAYAEEQAIKTSLLEGSVQVINGASRSRLRPGEQAIVIDKTKDINITTADMDAVIAWKNGVFEFNGADIRTILRQVARWYDVEIVFAGTVPLRHFEGKISRAAQLSDVLQILELSAIKFKVEGKKIIVQ